MAALNRRRFIQFGALGTSIFLTDGFSSLFQNKDQRVPQNTILPKSLSVGDNVAVVGLAGALWDLSVVDSFRTTLNDLGLNVCFAPSVYKRFGYLAGNDQDRLEDLKQNLFDPEIKAIFFIRGGWGTARIMDKIQWNWFSENPKIIVGFSDITYLLNAITRETGLVTFHGPVGNSGWNSFTVEALKQSLFKVTPLSYQLDTQDIKSAFIQKSGKTSGALVGGNLCVFTSMLGSPYFPDCKNKILFLEETDEEPYSIDRMLTSLRLAGVFDEINGLILGKFSKCSPETPSQSFTLHEVLKLHFNEAKFPIMSNAPIGHNRNKWTLPLGVELELDSELHTIRYLFPSVV